MNIHNYKIQKSVIKKINMKEGGIATVGIIELLRNI